MVDIRDRVRNKALHSKIVTAEEAAAIIKPGMTIGASGFTPAGYPKAVPLALAERMKKTLHTELGIEPAEETKRLFAELMK